MFKNITTVLNILTKKFNVLNIFSTEIFQGFYDILFSKLVLKISYNNYD